MRLRSLCYHSSGLEAIITEIKGQPGKPSKKTTSEPVLFNTVEPWTGGNIDRGIEQIEPHYVTHHAAPTNLMTQRMGLLFCCRGSRHLLIAIIGKHTP